MAAFFKLKISNILEALWLFLITLEVNTDEGDASIILPNV